MSKKLALTIVLSVIVVTLCNFDQPAHAQWFTSSEWFKGSDDKKAKTSDTDKNKAKDKQKSSKTKKSTVAQKPKPKPKSAKKTAKQPAPKKTAPKKSGASDKTTKSAALPDPRRMHILIVSSIVAANHANKTGDYSVLHKLAAPSFQKNNSPSELKKIFANLRKRNLDFSPVILYSPKLLRQPTIDNNGLLRLVGFFDTRPERVVYDTAFQKVGKDWKLFGISLNTRPAKVAAKQPPAKPTSKPSKSPSSAVKKK